MPFAVSPAFTPFFFASSSISALLTMLNFTSVLAGIDSMLLTTLEYFVLFLMEVSALRCKIVSLLASLSLNSRTFLVAVSLASSLASFMPIAVVLLFLFSLFRSLCSAFVIVPSDSFARSSLTVFAMSLSLMSRPALYPSRFTFFDVFFNCFCAVLYAGEYMSADSSFAVFRVAFDASSAGRFSPISA